MSAHEIPTISVCRPVAMDGSEMAKMRLAVPVVKETSRIVPRSRAVARDVILNRGRVVK